MINELEKQFFDTFGIKPLMKNIPCSECEFRLEECGCFYCNRETYPQITDRILLELIVILGSIFICVEDVETLKDHILNQCIMNQESIKHQVQSLFKEIE